MIDLPEGKRTEEVLRQSEERFRRLVELMPVAVYVCDTSGIIQSFNNRAVELWGRELKALLGGEITISALPGKGTTVSARIPESPPNPPEEGK